MEVAPEAPCKARRTRLAVGYGGSAVGNRMSVEQRACRLPQASHLLVRFYVPPGQDGPTLRLSVRALRLVGIFQLREAEAQLFRWDCRSLGSPAGPHVGNEGVGQFDLQVLELSPARLPHHEIDFFDVSTRGAVEHQQGR